MAAVLLGACAAVVIRSIPSGAPPPAPHTASLLAGGRTNATLRVSTGTIDLTIGVADLGAGGTLLRASTPPGSPPPQLSQAGTALVDLSASGASAVTVTLNAAVSWQLDLAGGTRRTVADLRGGRVAGITITAGSDVIDLTLPAPDGSVPVLLAAGTSQLLVAVPGGVPVRVIAVKGAGHVSLGGRDHASVADGSVFTTRDWAPGGPGYAIDATAGAGRIAVATWAG
jgi:hypothetical protein